MKRGLASMYDRLTAEERFRLVVEACAREDERETERLTSTCPRKEYEMNDLAFVDRLRASQLISSYVCAELVEVVGMLRTNEASRKAFEINQEALFSSLERVIEEAALSYHQGWDTGCDHAWQAADKHGPFSWDDRTTLNERAKEMAGRIKAESRSKVSNGSYQNLLKELSEALRVRAWSIWVAFSRFCREQTDLEPETMLPACFPPALGLPEEVKNLAGSAQTDSTLSDDYEAMLVRSWRELVGT